MLNMRQKEILSILEKMNNYVTVEYISQQIGVSTRTVHTELKKLETHISKLGKCISRKRGVGIKLENIDEQTKVDISYLDTYSEDTYNLFNRRIQIMKDLLFDRATVSFNQLSERYLVSKTSIDNDFDKILNILQAGSDIILESSSKGTRLVGTETEFQKALLQFNRYILRNMQLYKENEDYKVTEILKEYYGLEVVNICNDCLYKYIRENLNIITDYYIQNILNIFIILIFEIKHDKHIEYSEGVQFAIGNNEFDEHAKNLLNSVCDRLDYKYTTEDIQFFSQNLILNRFGVLKEDKYKNISKSIIESISNSLRVQIENEKELFLQLMSHIPPMIYRLKLNHKTENPFTEQIKTEFPLTFQNIWIVLSEYEDILDIRFNEDEIAFLTIYFQSAIERLKLNHKILIVCQMGVATSELIKNRLRSILSAVDLIEVAAVDSLKEISYDQWDLIISTVKLNVDNKNILYVSPFLTDLDIDKIKIFLNMDKEKITEKDSKRNNILSKYIVHENIFLNVNFSSKDELIETMGQYLIKTGNVSEQFIFDMENRELLGGTDLPSGVAVPHGNPNNVNKTNIVFIKNSKKFKWDKYYVDVIFMICISKEDNKKTRMILSDIYNIVKNKKILQKIRNINNADDLLNILGE